MFPTGFSLIVDTTRRLARSALPDAPVVQDADAAPMSTRARVALAAALRTLASRIGGAAERVEPWYLRTGRGDPQPSP